MVAISRHTKLYSLLDTVGAVLSSPHCHVSMTLSLNDFVVAVLDVKQNTYLGLEQYSFQDATAFSQLKDVLSSILNQSTHLAKSYKSYSLACVHPKSTLVPAALFDATNKLNYFSINHQPEPNDEISNEKLRYLDCQNIYTIDSEIKKIFLKKFVGIRFIHHSSSLIDGVLFKYKNATTSKFIVQVQSGQLDILVIQNKNLVFYNCFIYKSQEDFIYYILFVFDQLKLNPEEQEVELLGEINRKSNLYDLLFKYIRFIKFGTRIDSFKYHTNLDSLPAHFFYTIFNQYSCVS
ncbi:MAG: DUF3822 family protein [Bacteroidetes bacterium]|nr:DUF3822 family protein [Bacteroidota bacterium]